MTSIPFFSSAREALLPGFLQARARTLVHRLLAGIRYGQITLVDHQGRHTFGTDANLACTVIIHHPQAYQRMLFGGSVGAGEAYVDGLWETDQLTRLIRIAVGNQAMLESMEKASSAMARMARGLLHRWRRNHRRGARANILAHYDLGNPLYAAFLDPTMTYSSAIYPTPESTLEEAARFKLDHICRQLDLSPRDHVLEIGSGWGGFAIHAATHFGCRITTTTISDAQYQEAASRIAQAGLNDRINLLRKDYRDLEGTYDKLVSIEMIEAVGHDYLPGFFDKCMALLRPEGMMLLQAITIRDQKYYDYVRNVDFIQKHIFPGGCLVTNSRMLDLLARRTDLVVRRLTDFGFHYARTLRDWRHRFLAAFGGLKAHGYDERFRRLWEFYLCYCEGAFLERAISVVQVVADRPLNRQAGSDR